MTTTYKILDIATKEIVDTGLNLNQARRMCLLNKRFVFLPE